ncbi:MAG: D-TA family PLP-dependent enzyme [Fimbriiglobus sp.]
MPHPYHLGDEASVLTPSLVFYPEFIRKNIARVIEMVGDVSRLRPHVKTHKTMEIVRLQLAAGVLKHKCATIAEAEMLAQCGAPDVLLAYPAIGPTATRLTRLADAYRDTVFSALVDSETGFENLSSAAQRAELTVGVYLDLDVGMHRTGIAIGPDAEALYARIHETPGLVPLGLHAYDGHNHQEAEADRETAAREALRPVLEFREKLQTRFPCETIIAGGTPTFPMYARLQDVPGLECSPGTYVLHDNGYGSRYPDFSGITPAAVLLTRVISKPTANRVTLDLGHKAVAAEQPLIKRVQLLDAPPHTFIGQSEEHLILEADANHFEVGQLFYAIPWHICPTCALHSHAQIAERGELITRWEIASRNRVLTY